MDKNTQAIGQILRVTYIAMGVNVLLVVLKFLVGIITGSLAITADAVHSLSDFINDFAVVIGAKLGSKKPDAEHQYGHAWIETAIAGGIAIVLGFVGCATIYRAIDQIAHQQHNLLGLPVGLVALCASIAKELMFRMTRKTAVWLQCPMLYANAWDQRSDALSSLAVLVGFVAYKFGLYYADQFAAVVVGVMILVVAVKVIGNCLGDFTARSVDAKTAEQIQDIIASQKQIKRWHGLRTRTVGRELFMELHILVEPSLGITEAHQVSEQLEQKLHENISRPVNITVHIEPDIPAFRRE